MKSSNIVAIIIALAVLALGYYWLIEGNMSSNNSPEPTTELPSGSDTSDEALEEDYAAINAQVEAFGSDNAETDASLDDEPVEQSSI